MIRWRRTPRSRTLRGMGPYNGFSGDQRNRAQRWLNEGFAAGLFPRPTICRACGQTQGIIDSHAEDYSEPFGPHLLEYPLCVVCHMMLHWRFRDPALWDRYRALIAAGYRHPPHVQASAAL